MGKGIIAGFTLGIKKKDIGCHSSFFILGDTNNCGFALPCCILLYDFGVSPALYLWP
jgi:hypothetical protein